MERVDPWEGYDPVAEAEEVLRRSALRGGGRGADGGHIEVLGKVLGSGNSASTRFSEGG
jgi:hypothetical protein